MIKKNGFNAQKFLNQLSRDIKNKELSFETNDDKNNLSRKLIDMIGSGSEHRDRRIIKLMKKAHKVKPYADPYSIEE